MDCTRWLIMEMNDDDGDKDDDNGDDGSIW